MISVDGLVQLDSPGLVTNLASGITTALGAVTTQATAVQSTWSGLAGSYDAPEEHLVLTAMDEPVSVAEDLEAKGETVRTALEAYAETLEELHQRKNTLIADIGAFYEKKAQTEAENADNSVWEDVKDAFNDEDVKLMQAEEALSDRAAQLQYDKEAAERACANAIGDVWGAEHYEAAGESWVSDTTVYGATVEGYQDAVRSGQAAWGHPSMWSEGDWTTKVAQVFDGAGQSLAGTFGFFGDLVGVDGGGQAKAAWSGLGQLAMDVNNMTGVGAVGWFFNPEANQESAGRLWEMGKGIIGIGTWGTSGWQTGGGLGLDVALGVASGGTAFAVKGGLKGAAKGAAAASKVPGSSLSAGALTNGLRNAVKGGLDGSVKGLNTWWETSKGNLRGLMPQLAPAGGTPGGRHQFDVTMPDRDTGRANREAEAPAGVSGGGNKPDHSPSDAGSNGSDEPQAGTPAGRWSTSGARQQWVDRWLADPRHVVPERHPGPAYDYQRAHAGDVQVQLRTHDDSVEILADGLHVDPDKVVAVDAKYVVHPDSGRSVYEGGRPEFLYKEFDDEMRRYAAVVRDPENPVDRVRIVTNTDKAARYLAERASRILGPDVELDVVVREGLSE